MSEIRIGLVAWSEPREVGVVLTLGCSEANGSWNWVHGIDGRLCAFFGLCSSLVFFGTLSRYAASYPTRHKSFLRYDSRSGKPSRELPAPKKVGRTGRGAETEENVGVALQQTDKEAVQSCVLERRRVLRPGWPFTADLSLPHEALLAMNIFHFFSCSEQTKNSNTRRQSYFSVVIYRRRQEWQLASCG